MAANFLYPILKSFFFRIILLDILASPIVPFPNEIPWTLEWYIVTLYDRYIPISTFYRIYLFEILLFILNPLDLTFLTNVRKIFCVCLLVILKCQTYYSLWLKFKKKNRYIYLQVTYIHEVLFLSLILCFDFSFTTMLDWVQISYWRNMASRFGQEKALKKVVAKLKICVLSYVFQLETW